MSKVSVVDVFCGAGGLSYGLKEAGLNVILGIDNNPACEYPFVQNINADFICSDVEKDNDYIIQTIKDKLNTQNTKYKAIVGCAPCQPFSKHTVKYKKHGQDSRWFLIEKFAEIINKISPDIVSMENVPQLVKQDIFTKFVDNLQSQGYDVNYKVVDASHYDVPQTRKRLILLASKLGVIKLNEPSSNVKTVRDTIGCLPKINSGQTYENDPLHRAGLLSELNMKRIKASKEGGTWKDWSEDLLPKCYTRDTGKTYQSVYGRMSWDKPAPTLTTQFFIYGTGRYGHPTQDRPISLREGAMLQSFPADYKFFDNNTTVNGGKVAKLIGNAVPPNLAKHIGLSIINHINR